jgi:hypothetical protein
VLCTARVDDAARRRLARPEIWFSLGVPESTWNVASVEAVPFGTFVSLIALNSPTSLSASAVTTA